MMVAGQSLLLVALVIQSPAADSLRLMAKQLPESALVTATRARPLEVREALGTLLVRAVKGPVAESNEELRRARRLAGAYAVAWRDSFLLREVTRFGAWPPERRATKVWTDSVRRAGNTAYGRAGPTAGIAIWRRALAGAEAIGDTAGAAATLGNIGAAFARSGQLDSAGSYLNRSRALALEVGNLRVLANTTAELAGIREKQEDLAGARTLYAHAMALRERTGDTRGLAADYNNLAGLARTAGDLDDARRQLEAALALNRRDGRDEIAATNLVNLAGLAAQTGDFARAEALYREALTSWRARRQWTDVADALRGLGQLGVRRGDYPAARAELREALAIYDRTGLLVDALAVRQELAGVLGASGELQGALDELRRAQRQADSARVTPGVRAGISMARADLAVQLNTRAEAERLYGGAEQLYRRAGDRAGEAAAEEGRGRLLLARDDIAGAQVVLDAALRTQLALGNSRAAALTRLSLGRASVGRGDTATARRQLAQAAGELERVGDPVASAAALGEQAALESEARAPVAAESLYRAALGKVGGLLAPEVTWRLHAGLAAARQQLGSLDAAASELRAAIADIERTGRSLALAERRSGFLADKADVYTRLAFLERTGGRLSAAFDVSERVRAREMQELLALGRVAAPADTAADLTGREQDLRRRIGELTRDLEGAVGQHQALRGPDVALGGAVTREALVRAQEAYAELRLEIRERAPRHAALLSGETATWRSVAQHLGGDEAFIEYLVGEASSLAFVITRDTLASVELGVGRHDLAGLVDFVRGTLEPRGAPRVDSLWRGPLRRLFQDLIAPLEDSGLLSGKTRLTLVPQAELHYLPFAALIDGASGRFLVERYEVTVTPSATVWLSLGDRRPGQASTGLLAMAPRPDALPATREEVAAIARADGADARVLTGSAATEAAFRREAPSRRILHLATYGVLNKQNPLFSFVELAPGGGEDGRLEVHEVFGLHLAADLVVLSACQTGLGSGTLADVPAGDDWVGLARAFLYAGAARVVASLWPVRDRATATLMERLYQSFAAGADPGSALATAQRALLAAPATSHPYYWAGFELVGAR